MSNIRITQRWVDKHKPCIEALKKYKHLIGKSVKRVMEELIKNDDFDYANWLIAKVLKKDDLMQYAIYSAELVLHIFEKKYPGDTRPREAIEAAKKYAADAARAADADAAAAAAYAAADAAAYAAAYAAARAAIKNDILYYGLRLILGDEKLKEGQAKNQDGSGSGICCGD